MYIVSYRAATQVSQVANRLAGSFTYYADPVKALDSGCFVEKRVEWREGPFHFDFLGEPFREATKEEIRAFA